MVAEAIRLRHHLSPGDLVVMTAAIESLHRQFPGRYITDLDTSFNEVFENNPWVTKLKDARTVQVDYGPEVSAADKRPIHYLEGYCYAIGRALGIPLNCLVNRPYLYLSEEEKSWTKATVEHPPHWEGPYWLLNASYKQDYTVKKWRQQYFQDVIDHFKGRIKFFTVGGNAPDHVHAKLDGVINFVGRFDLRGLFRIAYHAQGALTVESLLSHVMAGFSKPCVTLSSGLYPQSWLGYPSQKLITYAPCMQSCMKGNAACWRFRVEKLNDGSHHDEVLCLRSHNDGNETVAECMNLIRPDEVIHSIEAFLAGIKDQ